MKEPKIENPILIILNDKGVSYYINGMKEPQYITYKVYFRNIMYGFIIISNGNKVEYQTHGTIYGLGINLKNNNIHIFEVGKTNPWVFNKNGELIRCAQFSNIDLYDKIYLQSQYGIPSNCNLEEANNLLIRSLKQR